MFLKMIALVKKYFFLNVGECLNEAPQINGK